MKQSNKLPYVGGRRLQPSDRQRARDAARAPPETAAAKEPMWKARDISVHLDLPADAEEGEFHILNQLQEFYPGVLRPESESDIKLHDIIATVVFGYDAQIAQYFFSQDTKFFEMYTTDKAKRLDFVVEKVPYMMTFIYRENDVEFMEEIDYFYCEDGAWVIGGGCIREGDGDRVRIKSDRAERDSSKIALKMWQAFRFDRLDVHAKKSQDLPDWVATKQQAAAQLQKVRLQK